VSIDNINKNDEERYPVRVCRQGHPYHLMSIRTLPEEDSRRIIPKRRLRIPYEIRSPTRCNRVEKEDRKKHRKSKKEKELKSN